MKIEDQQLYDQLCEIEKRIKSDEGKSVVARWEFGRALVQRRDGSKQLPKGVLAAVVKEHGISRSEINRRMQLAEKFKSKEAVSHAWDKYGSWRRLVSEALPKRETAPKRAWDARMSRRLNMIIDDAETEDQLETLAELFRKALKRVEPSQDVVRMDVAS